MHFADGPGRNANAKIGLGGCAGLDGAMDGVFEGEARVDGELKGMAVVLPGDGGRLEEMDVEAVGRDGVDVLGDGAEQAGSLAFATGVDVG